MGFGINTNVATLTAQRMLGGNQSAMTTALQRLSSGLRINSAKDDAAGTAIAERFTSQIRGANQAARNANDAISLLQTAEGSLANTGNNLQRIRELAVQAANGTNSASDRQALQVEVNQLAAEIDRSAATAQFNGMFIFDQSHASAIGDPDKLAVMAGLHNTGGWLENAESMISSLYGISGDGAAISIELSTFTDGVGGVAAQVVSSVPGSGKGTNIKLQVDMADFTPANLPNGGNSPFYNDRIIAHEMVHAVMARATNYGLMSANANYQWFIEGTAEFIHGADERVQSDIAANGGGAAGRSAVAGALTGGFSVTSLDYSAAYSATRYLHSKIKAAGGTGIKDMLTYLQANPGADLDAAFANASHGTYADNATFLADYAANGAAFISTFDFANTDTGAIGGADVDGGAVKTAESVVPNTASRMGDDVLSGFTETFEAVGGGGGGSKAMTFQVGANAGDTLTTLVGGANLGTMALQNTLDVVNGAAMTITSVDQALDYVNGQRARIGAQMSRLDSAISNLQVSSENMSASRSRIQDADFAQETAKLASASILQQAGTAMVAQANSLNNGVLALLRL